MSEEKTVRIELTDAQKRQIQKATGKDAKAIELTAAELEERVSPMYPPGPKGAAE
jgi:hypothetical protein